MIGVSFAQLGEEFAHILDEQRRLFEGRKVSACGHLRVTLHICLQALW